MRPYRHVRSSARGRDWRDDLAIRGFLDAAKHACADRRHRAMLHHVDLGAEVARAAFPDRGDVGTVVRSHVVEDLGHAATLADWFALCDADALPRPVARPVARRVAWRVARRVAEGADGVARRIVAKLPAGAGSAARGVCAFLFRPCAFLPDAPERALPLLMNCAGPMVVRRVFGPPVELAEGGVVDRGRIAEAAQRVGPEPILLAECPHKYDDAWYDDVWHAVQAGPTWWEQSQFFEEMTPPRVEERARYETDLDADAIRASGAAPTGERVEALRCVLRGLQRDGWRDAVRAATAPERDLIALVVEHGQRWLVLETPNAYDASILAWDADGLVRVGTTSRIDQTVGHERLLVFERVEADATRRLGPRARACFHPSVVDGAAAMALGDLLWTAVGTARAATGGDGRAGRSGVAELAWIASGRYRTRLASRGVLCRGAAVRGGRAAGAARRRLAIRPPALWAGQGKPALGACQGSA